MEWYVMVWKQYAEFSGRARRKEYWMFTLIHSLILLGVYLVGLLLSVFLIGIPLLILGGLYSLAAVIPSLAVSVRRLHDVGKSGWWLLLGFIPIVGAIILLVWHATEGEPAPNLYGPNPKALPAPAASTEVTLGSGV